MNASMVGDRENLSDPNYYQVLSWQQRIQLIEFIKVLVDSESNRGLGLVSVTGTLESDTWGS